MTEAQKHIREWRDGISDIEGQTAMVAASTLGNERVSNRESRRGHGGDWGAQTTGLWRVWRLAKRTSYAIKMPLS